MLSRIKTKLELIKSRNEPYGGVNLTLFGDFT